MLVERTRLLLLAVVAGLVAAPATASAAKTSPKAACVAAHEAGQTLRTQNKPHAAREKFVACARTECPVVLRKECGEQIDAMEAIAPSVALEARDEQGMSDPAVKVSIDGKVVAEKLTGGSIDVEPGDHTIRFERGDGKVIEQTVLVASGEKNRKVVAEFASLVPKPPPQEGAPAQGPAPERRVPALAYVSGGVALAALGSFAFFAVHGKSTEDDLAGRCAPSCTADDVRPVQRDYLVADVSLGVAVVAAAVAVVLALPALVAPAKVQTARISDRPWMPRVRMRSAAP